MSQITMENRLSAADYDVDRVIADCITGKSVATERSYAVVLCSFCVSQKVTPHILLRTCCGQIHVGNLWGSINDCNGPYRSRIFKRCTAGEE